MEPTIALMDSNYRFIVFDGKLVAYEADKKKMTSEINETLGGLKEGKYCADSGYGVLGHRDDRTGVVMELTPEKLVVAAPIWYHGVKPNTRRGAEGIAFYIKERNGCTDVVEELKLAYKMIVTDKNYGTFEELKIQDVSSKHFDAIINECIKESGVCDSQGIDPDTSIVSEKPSVIDYCELTGDDFKTEISSKENMLVFFANLGSVPGQYLNQCDVIVTHKEEYLRTHKDQKRKSNEPLYSPPKKKSLVSKFGDILRR